MTDRSAYDASRNGGAMGSYPYLDIERGFPVEIAFVFDDHEKNDLIDTFLEIDRNPYAEYDAFSIVVDDLATSGVVPKRFADFCESRKEVDLFENPYVLTGKYSR